MPVAYSEDLRWRAVWLCLYMEVGVEDTANMLHMSERSVYRYVKRFNTTGRVAKEHHTNGPSHSLSEQDELFVVNLILTKPGIFLREIRLELLLATGHVLHESTICRSLKRLGMTRQKIQHLALQRSDAQRADFVANIMSAYQSSLFLWIDETGCDRRNGLRKYGYSIRGFPPQSFSLRYRGTRYSAIGIMSSEGIEDIYITKGTVNGDVFLDFVQKQLIPILNPFDGASPHSVVILDNASIHHTNDVLAAILSTGALVKFLPPYSPDMNPIEFVFGEMKQYLLSNYLLFHTSLSFESILYMAFNSITPENCKAYIKFTGYI